MISNVKKKFVNMFISSLKKNIFKLIIIISIFLFYLSNSSDLTKERFKNQSNFNQIQSQIEEENFLTNENKINEETNENTNLSNESSIFFENEILQKSLETNEKWKLIIPIIDLEAQIAEGTTKDVLEEYIGHFEETSRTNGNVGLAAHNRGYKTNYFMNLKYLKEGDEVIYCYDDVERRYYVKTHEIIKDTDWSFLQNTEENVITLITCVEDEPEYRRCIQAIKE